MSKKNSKNVTAERETSILDKFKEKRKKLQNNDSEGSDISTGKNLENVEAKKEIDILEKLYQKKKEKDNTNKLEETEKEENNNHKSNNDKEHYEDDNKEHTGIEEQAKQKRDSLLDIEDASDLESDEFWEYYLITALEEELGFLSLTNDALAVEMKQIIEEYAENKEVAGMALKQGIRNVRKRFRSLLEKID